ncbi:MAG: hypothetical protein WC083_06355 [Candidatus Methanomethylophilaceae archaeon]|jgi:hypothetical protein
MERCEAVPLASALRLSTVESALGVTEARMREIEAITHEVIAGKQKVAEALHAIAFCDWNER